MEYRFLNNDQINRQKWDEVISNDSSMPAFAYSWYLDVVSEKWGAVVSRDYETLLPIVFNRKFGINYIYQPFFTRNFGIYGQKPDPEEMHIVMNQLEQNFRYWDFNVERDNIEFFNHAKATPRVFQELDLNLNYDDLQKNYSTKLRRSLRLASEEKLSIVSASDNRHFTNEFKRYTSGRISEFKQGDYIRLESLLNKCVEKGETLHYSVLKDKLEVASAFFLKTGNQIIYIEGYSSPEGRELRAMHLIFDLIISKYAGQPFKLDFGGSNIPSIAHFFHSFGAKDKVYFNVKLNKLPPLIRWLKK